MRTRHFVEMKSRPALRPHEADRQARSQVIRCGELPLQCRLATLEILQSLIKAFAAPTFGEQAQCHDAMDDGQSWGIKNHRMKEPPQHVAKEGAENRQSHWQNPLLAEHGLVLAAKSL